jgi:hypothetical protein
MSYFKNYDLRNFPKIIILHMGPYHMFSIKEIKVSFFTDYGIMENIN